ncbi:protein NRT1/ PTR FAMILY 4.6-like [Populus alba x Populus x berolinensis]|nr:protein NRT1/ PTR FAMILY 4.6-like [Populus alba x Populus x berolinensis]
MDEAHMLNTCEGYVDWRNRPAVRGRHGGILAASFVLVVEVLENLAFLANASNLVLYLSKFMHFSPSSSANVVTNFMGTAFLLALLGGFLADAFLPTYYIYLISASIESLGLLVLTIQAHVTSLKPPPCLSASTSISCEQVDGRKALMLFAGLYLVTLGVGGIKGSLPPHGAEQFDENTLQGRKQRSAFFNYYVFCLSCGALIAVTIVVWVEDNKGWQWGFGVSTATILLSIPIFLIGSPVYRTKVPIGSPVTTIFKVLAAAVYNTYKFRDSSNSAIEMDSSRTCYTTETSEGEDRNTKRKELSQTPTESLEFVNRSVKNKTVNPMLECTAEQVEEVKTVLRILPIFMSTIMLNCCLAQLSTFSVQQASTMNTDLGSLKVPPASLPVFPVVFIMILAPIYNHIITPFARKVTKSEMGITHLQRIGTGLVLSVVAMAVAALVEMKRKRVAANSGLVNSTKPLPITFLWIALQYLFLGSADLFTLAGMMEFFFTEAPKSMRSLATSLSWASLAMGYYLSSVLVSLINTITSKYRDTPWLSGSNLNKYHLERFYWLMCILSGLNLSHYLFWASRYKYKSMTKSLSQPKN